MSLPGPLSAVLRGRLAVVARPRRRPVASTRGVLLCGSCPRRACVGSRRGRVCRGATWVTAMMWIAWFNARLPRRVQPVPVGVGARCFDRCGAVVVGELGAGAEAADVTDVAEHDRGDRPGRHRAARASVVPDAVTASVIRCLIAAISRSRRSMSPRCSAARRQRSTADRVAGLDAVEQLTAPELRVTRSGAPPGDELAEHHVQPARGLGAQTGEVVMTVGEQPQHRGVVVASDRSQSAVTHPGDRGRQARRSGRSSRSSTTPTAAPEPTTSAGHRPRVHRRRRAAGRAADRGRRRTRSPTPARRRAVPPTPTGARSGARSAGTCSRATGCSSRSTATAVWVDLCGSIPIITDIELLLVIIGWDVTAGTPDEDAERLFRATP